MNDVPNSPLSVAPERGAVQQAPARESLPGTEEIEGLQRLFARGKRSRRGSSAHNGRQKGARKEQWEETHLEQQRAQLACNEQMSNLTSFLSWCTSTHQAESASSSSASWAPSTQNEPSLLKKKQLSMPGEK